MAMAQTQQATDEPAILCRVQDGVRRITLNRPARRNALSEELSAALQASLDEAAEDGATRVIVIASTGRAFCAGHDMRELQAARDSADRGRAYFERVFERSARLMLSVVRHPRPVIADVRGVATAAGCQLMASCDIAIASEAARFATPGVDIGLFCSTPMVALSRKVGRNHAMEMLLTGEAIDARRAYEIGLVNHVFPAAAMDREVGRIAGLIASKSLKTVALGKAAFHRQREMAVEDAYAHACQVMVENMLARDCEEGIAAFLDKRAPQWEDR